jgi:hypothetical protein
MISNQMFKVGHLQYNVQNKLTNLGSLQTSPALMMMSCFLAPGDVSSVECVLSSIEYVL